MYNQEEPKLLLKSSSSHRPDLTTEKRIKIACMALFFHVYGTVTKLSQKYNISRQFVYELKNELDYFCKGSENIIELSHENRLFRAYETTLFLRFEGKCSINSISSIMKRWNMPYASVGAISEHLTLAGKSLPNIIDKSDTVTYAIFASDEIYSKRRPILITCDPVSFVILQVKLCKSCTSAVWEKEWEQLKANGVIPLYIVKDEGTEMECASAKIFPNTNIQSDTYHAVSHKLGLWHIRLEAYAYKKIEIEYEKERLLNNSKTEETRIKRELEYQTAKNKTVRALNNLDDFEFIYFNLLSCFELFDCNGNLKNKNEVIEKFEAALELGIECLEYETLKKRLKSISKITNRLFYFFDIAKNILKELEKEVDTFTLNIICLYWQTHKRLNKTKDSQIGKRIKEHENKLLADIQALIGDDSKQTMEIDKCIKKLNCIVQSSSAVECINSILRPYLNSSKNQTSQEFLNLFMFYHNHRRFRAGERKGHTPMELFTGEKQSRDWLSLLMDKLKNKIE
ncbi:MAG: hypothetical protein KAI79_20145 [Bacteroidales bacterium]|nr:hypothetical protein [Bacteroidales bacterium]